MVGKLAATPAHPTLSFLNFSQNRIGGKTAEIFAAPFFSRVVTVDLYGNPLGEAGLAKLAAAELPRLERLKLHRVDATTKGVAGLVVAPFARRLTHLDLGWNDALDDGVARVLVEADLPRLEALFVPERKLGKAAIAALRARFPNVPADYVDVFRARS